MNSRLQTPHAVRILLIAVIIGLPVPDGRASEPIVGKSVVFAEHDGVVAVEAEHFVSQSETETRAFHLTTADSSPGITPDGDPSHVAGASGGAYLEILPDTRRTHGDKLIRGENFSPEPGKLAVLRYKVRFSTPGRYYVWVRAHSTGSEDNGLHVGIDGSWPETGQRLQWCEGKRTWRWDSKQRTQEQHCGEPHKIYLDVDQPGEHTIQFSMREDGFEFDKWIMTTDRDFVRPNGPGPKSVVHRGELPKPFRFVAVQRTFPAHWGDPPKLQTRDLRPLPGGYGRGSSTLAKWIQENLDKDAAEANSPATSLVMPAAVFAASETPGYYLDRGKWLAVNPDRNKSGEVGRTFPYPTGLYNVTLQAVGESDGKSEYEVRVDDELVGRFVSPLSKQMYEEGPAYNQTWPKIRITEGAIIHVASQIGTNDGQEFSRARWAAVSFEPADEATKKEAAPLLAQQARAAASQGPAATRPATSPTKPLSDQPLIQPRGTDGDGSVEISGELKTWHKVTLTLDGPFAHEQDNKPNPFTDTRLTVTFSHADGSRYVVPGYFAADGDAGNSSAEAGTKWRAHFSPDRTGQWTYQISFRQGKLAALNDEAAASPIQPFDGKSGSFQIAATDKQGRDLRAHGRLQYVGKHYLQFAGTGQYFLKVGADAPETLLAYKDFDNTFAGNPKKAPLKSWSPHLKDWRDGDPTWSGDKGKGLIGAINYLSAKGCNAFSFLTYNAGGDGDNVWPFIHRDDKLHYDCSKLDQWGVVFDHGTNRGMYLHFKMQETENDDHKKGKNPSGTVPESLDGGNLGAQRKLYCRELIARFGHNLALNWNLGEENTQTNAQQRAMIDYIAALDAYDHNIVVHTFPGEQNKVYEALLGDKSKLTGVSLQNSSLKTTHEQTLKWVRASAAAGKPWIVAFDESGSAAHAQCPDLGYQGFDGRDRTGKMVYTEHEVRKQTLWGTLMAGGAGNEYYFGYQFAENDIVCEDWRSRDRSWDYCRHAIRFFHDNQIPFWEMQNADELVGNPDHDVSRFCFVKPDEVYLVYLPDGGTTSLDLRQAKGEFRVEWFNPRTGGSLVPGSVTSVSGGKKVDFGDPPTDDAEDWLAVVRSKS